ncbi:MAG: glycosyltransferase [Caldilineaceae bacterium]
MNILFVVPYAPNSIRVRPYELLRTLARHKHCVTLATLWQNEQERQELAMLTALGIEIIAQPLPKPRSLWNCVQALPGHAPLQAAYCWQPRLAQQLHQIVNQRVFDVIHVEHLRGAWYGLALKEALQAANHRAPLVWDSVDCISHLFAQAAVHRRSRIGKLLARLELQRTQRYEGWLVAQFDQVLVSSAADRQALLALTGAGSAAVQQPGNDAKGIANAQRLAVLPNGVDLEQFQQQGTQPSHKTIIFSGKMSYHANVTAALYLVQEIMPSVWAHDPTVQVQLVGKDPPAQLRALVTATANVVVTGAVPHMAPYLCNATLAVAPLLYGAGIQNKVLEAMACGAPVVASRQAAAGLQAAIGRDLLVADNAAAFATAILTLLNNPAQRAQLSQAGRAYVEQVHGWDGIGSQLEALYAAARRQIAVRATNDTLTDWTRPCTK